MGDLILDLCGGTGAWSQPYRQAGYAVMVVDPVVSAITDSDLTVEEFVDSHELPKAHGILAAPPCTEFAGSGARWRASKPPELLEEAIAVVRACLKIIERAQPQWWCLENPVGRLAKCVPELGKWKHTYHPYMYGGYSDDPSADAYTKKTCLWGDFNMPELKPIILPEAAKDRHRIHYASPGPERARLRSITPPGFALAFFEVNP